jgi:hypothetical protein
VLAEALPLAAAALAAWTAGGWLRRRAAEHDSERSLFSRAEALVEKGRLLAAAGI